MVVNSSVVNSSRVDPAHLDLGYLGLFLGMQVNRLVLERLHAAGYQKARESHGYLIQHLIEKDRSITELASRMEVTQQAASKSVAELAALGMVDILAAADRRKKTIRLSGRGRKLVDLSRKTRREVEQRLIRAAGVKRYREASATLAACLEELGGVERVRSRRIVQPQ
jgi:DNA-binding MarR family transcriptional regulator